MGDAGGAEYPSGDRIGPATAPACGTAMGENLLPSIGIIPPEEYTAAVDTAAAAADAAAAAAADLGVGTGVLHATDGIGDDIAAEKDPQLCSPANPAAGAAGVTVFELLADVAAGVLRLEKPILSPKGLSMTLGVWDTGVGDEAKLVSQLNALPVVVESMGMLPGAVSTRPNKLPCCCCHAGTRTGSILHCWLSGSSCNCCCCSCSPAAGAAVTAACCTRG